MLGGFDEPQLNKTLLETITHHTPAGTSTNTVIHYAQGINSKTFSHFDYGRKGNQEHYGSKDPPLVDMKLVTIPVASYWSDNDWLAHPSVSFASNKIVFTFEVFSK